MPVLIQHIDAIGRKKQRDVLYISFLPEGKELLQKSEFSTEDIQFMLNWESNTTRNQFLAWLNNSDLTYYPCGGYANENSMDSYHGDIYIDVPFDAENSLYKLLEGKLENPDGTMKIPGVSFRYMPLEISMRNTHHDEPGFWDEWAERF